MSEFDLWFPCKETRSEDPIARIICFHNAGATEQIYTNRGTPKKPCKVPLLKFCLENNCELLACQLPGRGTRWKDKKSESIQELATLIFFQLKKNNKFNVDIPYVFVAHSMGCLIIYELLVLIKQNNLPLPSDVFLSCMINPDTPMADRPWKKNKDLSDEEFKIECTGWDINKEIFQPSMWETYSSLLRSDFTLFDEYTCSNAAQKFDCNLHLLSAENDKRIKQNMMSGWKKFFTRKITEKILPKACHAFVFDEEKKEEWLKDVSERVDEIILDMQY